MIIEVQILSKVLKTKKLGVLDKIDVNKFDNFKTEAKYIKKFYSKYNKVPDQETFISKFEDFEILDVKESDSFLLESFHENQTFFMLKEIIEEVAEESTKDARLGVELLLERLKELPKMTSSIGVDIISEASKRLDEYNNKKNPEYKYIQKTGFQELDVLLGGGLELQEEFVVILARISQGKSWILTTFALQAWKDGLKVGFISPEMSAGRVGYRFDTLYKNIENRKLVKGEDVIGYEDYIKNLSSKTNSFIVATPLEFENDLTVSKLKRWVLENDIKYLAIDGLKYLKDDRRKGGDKLTESLTHISEDLMAMSMELKIPIVTVIQSNRGGVKSETDDMPDIENIKDSDGPGANASIVISIKQEDDKLKLAAKKNRNGPVNKILNYLWDINKGIFKYVPSDMDGMDDEYTEYEVHKLEKKYGEEDVF